MQAGHADTRTTEGAHNAALLRDQQALLLERGGASCVIAGCTEIPLVLPDGPTLLNPSQVLADEIVWRTIRDRT
jgi:aspartate/glutamate racemase